MMSTERFQFIVALNPNGRALMTRDMELIRKIFAEIKSREDAQLRSVEISGVDEAVLSRHLEMLIKAGLIDGESTGAHDALFPKIAVKDLSWEGHNIANAIMDDGIWKKIKEIYTPSEFAKLPLQTIGDVAKALITKWALSKAGLG